MPEYVCVCCYSCKRFQACQRRKDGKLNCKLCGEKQTVRKIWACSDKASEIRPVVMRLNAQRGQHEMQEKKERAVRMESESIIRSSLEVTKLLAKHDYTRRAADELSFKAGDVIVLDSKPEEEWWEGRMEGWWEGPKRPQQL